MIHMVFSCVFSEYLLHGTLATLPTPPSVQNLEQELQADQSPPRLSAHATGVKLETWNNSWRNFGRCEGSVPCKMDVKVKGTR